MGLQTGHVAPHSAPGEPHSGGWSTRYVQLEGRQSVLPSLFRTHESPAGHSMLLVQPVSLALHTPGQTPPQPSSEWPHVALEQSGVQMHGPHSDAPSPHLAGSSEGQPAGKHTSGEFASNAPPKSATQLSPGAQVLSGLFDVESHESTQEQLEPQGLSGWPHWPVAWLPPF